MHDLISIVENESDTIVVTNVLIEQFSFDNGVFAIVSRIAHEEFMVWNEIVLKPLLGVFFARVLAS